MTSIGLVSVEKTDVGRRRKNNEDAVLRLPDSGLFCVADGMGGAAYGGEASQLIIKSLAARMAAAGANVTLEETVQLAARAMNEASYRIRDLAEERGVSSVGSTVVILALDPLSPGRAVVLHAGDSRAYRLRAETLERLTLDHSIASALGISNEGSLPPMLRGVITNAVGIKPTVQLDKDAVTVRQGDLFLLCSDGLTHLIPDATLGEILRSQPGASIEAQAQLLIDRANAAGGDDNISVILVRIDTCPPGTDDEEADGDSPTDMTSRAAFSFKPGEEGTFTTQSVANGARPGARKNGNGVPT